MCVAFVGKSDSHGHDHGGHHTLIGVGCLLLELVFMAIGLLQQKKLAMKYPALSLTMWGYAGAFVIDWLVGWLVG